MTRTGAFITTFVFFVLSVSSGLLATEWHVATPPLGNDSNPGTSELPFATIQRGIDAASDGDTVIVAEGTYLENIQFNGKNIVLTSTDPLDPAVVESTIIDGHKAGSVVTFSGAETEACILSGFTIQTGAHGGIAGGTYSQQTQAIIENNTITGNAGSGLRFCDGRIQNNTITGNGGASGGGLYECNGTIQNNTITGNWAMWYYGGGLYMCNGTIHNNTIAGNWAYEDGGGLWQCNGTIHNNMITGNSAQWGCGGLSQCDGTIQDNTITSNSGYNGGGLSQCDGTIENNTITGNSGGSGGGGLNECGGAIQNNTITDNSGDGGGGLSQCDGTIENNMITGNSATGTSGGGGLAGCAGTIQNNTITGNLATHYGGGLSGCAGTIQNNTVVSNSATYDGGGLYRCEGTIRNCVIWGNTAPSGPQVYESNTPRFSCIESWSGGGQGNIASDPRFVDASAQDYRLQSGSPCIDAGANYYWFTWPQRDLDGNCRLVGHAVDIGCYEYGSSPDADGDLLSDSDESAAGTDPLDEDSDGDGLRDGVELLRESNPLQPTPPRILNVPSDIPTIQESLCISIAGDEIIVAPGTYAENLQFCGPDVMLRGSDPGDPNVVASTILDGGAAGPVVSFMGGESESCVLAGFTIRNGGGLGSGGGICGGTYDVHTHATIENNRITGNAGSGLRFCDGRIQNNTITGNSAFSGGGLHMCNGTIQSNTITDNTGCGLVLCNGTIQNNTISGNWTEGSGGGLASCDGTIQNNTIGGNRAEGYGGGLDYCNGTIRNNTITGNSASEGGGGLGECNGTIQNNTIAGNSADLLGGGLAACNGTIQNNTIANNSATEIGGGLYYCNGTIYNCIIWGNTAPSDPQLDESSIPTFSCIEGWSGGGEGNIASEPRFLDLNAGDYRLQEGSPCIDAGYNDPALPARDIAGMHRIMFGGNSLTVDMGAYEFHIWPPTEDTQAGEVTLKWSSLAGKSYSVYQSGDMLSWDILADNVSSAGDTVTTWIDSMGPVLPPGVRIRYYKVMENP